MLSEALALIQAGKFTSLGKIRNLGGFPEPPRFYNNPLPSYSELLAYPKILIKAAHRFIYGKNNKKPDLPNRFIGFQFIIGMLKHA